MLLLAHKPEILERKKKKKKSVIVHGPCRSDAQKKKEDIKKIIPINSTLNFPRKS